MCKYIYTCAHDAHVYSLHICLFINKHMCMYCTTIFPSMLVYKVMHCYIKSSSSSSSGRGIDSGRATADGLTPT